MRLHHCKQLVLGCGLVLLGACDKVPDDVAALHREAATSEKVAAAALYEPQSGLSRKDLERIRSSYEPAAEAALELRKRLERAIRLGGSSEKLAEARALNDDLLRCHEKLRMRAEKAFRLIESGRARRSLLDDIWGLVDPRRCFDELAPSWDALLS